MVGPKGRIGVLDTESGRARLYSDKVPGGFVLGELTLRPRISLPSVPPSPAFLALCSWNISPAPARVSGKILHAEDRLRQ